MTAKYYACFILEGEGPQGCRELGGVVEVDPAFHGLEYDEVAEILAADLEIEAGEVHVYHWSRLH